MHQPDSIPAPPVAPARHPALRNVPLLYAIRVLFWAHFFAAVMVPFFTQWGGLKLAHVFYLNAWFMFCSFVLEVPTGTVADFLGRKTSLALGGLVAGGAAWLYVSEPSWVRFALGELCLAVAFTLHSGADEALLYDSLKAAGAEHTAVRVLARLEACKLIGINVGALSGGWIAAQWGLTAPMRAYALPCLLVFALSLALREVRPGGPAAPRAGYFEILRSGARFFLSHPVLRLLSLELAVTNALAWVIIWLYQPVLQAAGLPYRYFGLVHAGACVAQITFLAQVDRLERLFGSRRRLLLGATVIAGAALLALAFVRWLPLVIPLIAAGFAFSLPRVAIYTAHFNALIPSARRATVLSFASMTRTLAIVCFNPLTGRLAEWSLPVALATVGGLLCLLPWFSRLEERHLEQRGAEPTG
jgi:MFS family permease